MTLRSRTSSLARTCPACGSKAITAAERRGASAGVTWLVCCGQCQVWRMVALSERASRRFEQRLWRERLRIADLLVQMPWADPDQELRKIATRR